MNRRDMLKTAGSVAAISILGGIPLSVSAKDKVAKVETAAGGTMCLLSDDWHIPMEQFRGIECRCKAAEAFVRYVEPASLV